MTMPIPAYPVAPYTQAELTKAFNQAVLSLFLEQPGAKTQHAPIVFLTSLYAGLQKQWDSTIPTACTNGKFLKINPDFFMWCSKGFRATVLAHETWHVGFLHCDPERRGNRHPRLWNDAIDYATNWMLHEQGFVFDKMWDGNPWGAPTSEIFGLLDARFAGMTAEQIYDVLWDEAVKVTAAAGNGSQPGDGSSNPFDGDVEEVLTKEEKHEIVGKVVQAIQQNQLASQPGTLPAGLEETIEALINPQLPWTTILRRYCTERSSFSHNWKRPNRRYKPHGLYLPSRGSQEGLGFILFACDDSGSMWPEDFVLMNSELKGIHEELKPEKIVMITCDTQINDVWEFSQQDTIEPLIFTGRGGTDIQPVFDYALSLADRPKLIIVASDLECDEPPNPGIDVLWLRFGDYGFHPSYGTTIQINC